MKPKISKSMRIGIIVVVLILALAVTVFAEDGAEAGYSSPLYGTFWAFIPPIIAIALALITKEVYISLFIGILSGAFLYSAGNPVLALTSVMDNMIAAVGDGWNVGIFIFLVMLGIIVALMNKAGGSAAYGRWASQRIKTRTAAQLSTMGLGVLIFIDDYFNCLTVGSVMMPVTDRNKISRAKLAYVIDATAAPVCIIAPISSWAAAVSSYVVGEAYEGIGFQLFLKAIPYNLYALLTLVMIVVISILKLDYGPMKKYEDIAEKTGDLYGGTGNEYVGEVRESENERGKVVDLILPIVVLILSCVVGMIYTGGFFDRWLSGGDPVSFIDAFAGCDASLGLPLGAMFTLIFVFIYYLARRVVTFKQFAEALPTGFRQMVPAILILAFALTLKNFVDGGLGAADFVGNNLAVAATGFASFLPAIFFIIACFVAFSTGTSWGTLGILVPIVCALFPDPNVPMVAITLSASMAGAVMGDHCSPISDTTIMSSTGAQCNHVQHVATQMPYAILVAAISFIGFIFLGFVQIWWLALVIGIVLLLVALLVIRAMQKKKA